VHADTNQCSTRATSLYRLGFEQCAQHRAPRWSLRTTCQRVCCAV
jgi:hypothetical protein